MTDNPFLKADLERLVAEELAKPSPAATAPAPERKRVSPWAQLATVAGNAFDAGTTIHALNQGAMEGNPMYGDHPSAGKVLGIKAGTTAAQLLLQHLLGKKSPGAANAMGFATGGLMGGIGAWNLTQANKLKKQK